MLEMRLGFAHLVLPPEKQSLIMRTRSQKVLWCRLEAALDGRSEVVILEVRMSE